MNSKKRVDIVKNNYLAIYLHIRKCYFLRLTVKNWTVQELISWKRSFKRLNEEYEMARKKQQALESLLNSNRISKSTYDSFNKEIEEAINEIENQKKALIEKMNLKAQELEGQIKTLEMLLANFEIQHVAGEVDDEIYQRQVSLLSIGLDNARQELDAIKDSINQLSTAMQASPAETVICDQVKTEASSAPSEIEVAQEPKPTVEISEVVTPLSSEEQPQTTSEPLAAESQAANEEKQGN